MQTRLNNIYSYSSDTAYCDWDCNRLS